MSYVVELKQGEAVDFANINRGIVGTWTAILSWRDEHGADEFVASFIQDWQRGRRPSGRAKSLVAAQAGKKRKAYQRHFDHTGKRWEVSERERRLAKRLKSRIDHATKVLTNEGYIVLAPPTS